MADKQNTKQKTVIKQNPDKNQVKYWQDRAEREFLAGEKEAFQVAKELKANYKRCITDIEKEINAFYGKYAVNNQISLEEAKLLLNRQELKSFKDNIKHMLAMGKKEDFTPEQLNKYKTLYVKTRISRLDELQSSIKWNLDVLTKANEEEIGQLLSNTYENQYYNSIFDVEKYKGYSSPFSSLSKDVVEKAVKTKWLGNNYSTNLWDNENKLINILEQEIPRGLALGYNPNKLARDVVSKRIDKQGYNNTVRLIRTEYNKIQTDATFDGYRAAGITKYQILATLDSRTSDICREMNDEIYNISEAETGVTAPPFHPNCRTTTVAYFEEDEFDRMTDDELERVTENLDTLDWLKNLVKQKEGKVQYENPEPITKATSDKTVWKNSLSKPEMEALQNYTWKESGDTTKANFEDINNYLRTGEVSKVGKHIIENAIGNIDSALNRFKLDNSITVYRGIDTPSLIEQVIGEKKYTRDLDSIKNYLNNKTIENKSFTSTSISRQAAGEFGLGRNTSILQINLPKGTKGAYLNDISYKTKEKEFLLTRNTQFKIKSIRYDNRLDKFVISCDLIEGGE